MAAKWSITLVTSLLALPAFVSAGGCQGQSCYIAYISGSTAKPYEIIGAKAAAGGSSSGEDCIKKYLKELKGLGANMSPLLGNSGLVRTKQEWFSEVMDAAPEARVRWADKTAETEEKMACEQNILLYARGTLEPGDNGITLGPPLVSAAKKEGWGVRSITSADGYGAGIADDFCVALPGGEACYKVLKQLASSCPTSNFFLAGYSQGAMVARICAAYQTEAVRQRIKGLVLFGDPMNGADVRGLSDSRVHTICRDDDGVCKGKFDIGFGHLAYGMNAKLIPDAITWMKQAASS